MILPVMRMAILQTSMLEKEEASSDWSSDEDGNYADNFFTALYSPHPCLHGLQMEKLWVLPVRRIEGVQVSLLEEELYFFTPVCHCLIPMAEDESSTTSSAYRRIR